MKSLRLISGLARRFSAIPKGDNLKLLREQTGAPLMKCKEALDKFPSLDQAKAYLRERNLILADKRSGNDASEGVLGINILKDRVLVAKVNSETDFVAKNDEFLSFVELAVKQLSSHSSHLPIGLTALTSELLTTVPASEGNLLEQQKLITAKIQENIKISEVFVDGYGKGEVVGCYVHKALKDNIGAALGYVVVRCDGHPDPAAVRQMAEDLAVHIFCKSPSYVSFESIPKELIEERKKEVMGSLDATFAKKPKEIQERIVDGKIRKAFDDEILLEQIAVFFDSEKTVADYIKQFESEHKTKVHIVKFNSFKVK